MASAANNFQKQLGTKLEKLFANEFKFYKSSLQLRRKSNNGTDIISLSGSNKWSPLIIVAFYFSRQFDDSKKILRIMGEDTSLTQIDQYSLNARLMTGTKYEGCGSWTVDIDNPQQDLAENIKIAIEALAFPFFERFSSLKVAQKASTSNDSWCLNPIGPCYHKLLLIDAALSELNHFKEWSKCLEPFYLEQAIADIDKYNKLIDKI